MLNRKFHISQISHCEKFVPIRHIFHTNISHFVTFAHVVKLYVAYMRNPHIDKIHPKSASFCSQFQFYTYVRILQRGSNRLQINVICFIAKSGTGVKLKINYMRKIARKRFLWSSCSRFASLCPCRYVIVIPWVVRLYVEIIHEL